MMERGEILFPEQVISELKRGQADVAAVRVAWPGSQGYHSCDDRSGLARTHNIEP